MLQIDEFIIDGDKLPVVGSRLGYYAQHEIFNLKNRINLLEKKIDELTRLK